MRPSRNAIIGYSYQKTIAFLLLAKMDAERTIEQIEIEATVNHNFDDVSLVIDGCSFYCQMKDFDEIAIKDIIVMEEFVSIKGNKHVLSNKLNIIFIKNLDIKANSTFLGFPTLLLNNVYIISLSRSEAWDKILSIYKNNEPRIAKLETFFDSMFDKRKLMIRRTDLPHIEIYSTELLDRTVNLQSIIINDTNIWHIVGKPGVGKSHLVNQLNIQGNNILYRFWISNQDLKYKERLEFHNFISNLSKDLFQNPIPKTENDVILELSKNKMILIIDGLDHVENYNPIDLNKYINFIKNLGAVGKVIVLSRPLCIKTEWESMTLNNWDYQQMAKFLDEYYHITEYSIQKEIYRLTDGYPIIVSFIAKHYKKYEEIPKLNKVSDLNEYYNAIIENSESKKALTLFLTSRSYFMISEISIFLDSFASELVLEFVEQCPYLFERKLNRVSLIHDSFTTYLRPLIVDKSRITDKVRKIVYESICNDESRFLSRFNYFNLTLETREQILKKYSSIEQFEYMINNHIDYEAIVSFYYQLRDVMSHITPSFLNLEEYYELSLIFNIIQRNHTASVNGFYYILAKTILKNGYTFEDVTSSEYLFSFLYFWEENDISLIKRVMSNDNYSTDNLYEDLSYDIYKEKNYYKNNNKSFRLSESTRELLSSDMEYQIKDVLEFVLLSSYIHGVTESSFAEMEKIIKIYIDASDLETAKAHLEIELNRFGVRKFFSNSILFNVKDKLESLGYLAERNDYKILTLGEYIDKYMKQGSFKVLERVTHYMRLSLYEKRYIDICSINKFLAMYHERKDYSVININSAFTIFEALRMIDESNSCNLIIKAQDMSEKGIRTIFKEYIEMHDVSILKTIEENYILDDINVEWFDLPPKYIDAFSDNLFHNAMRRVLKYHSYSGRIEIKDIENVLSSKRFTEIVRTLNVVKYTVELNDNHKLLKKLKEEGVMISIVSSEISNSEYTKDSAQRIDEGIITINDMDIVKQMGLRPSEIAGYTNGWYMLLTDIQIFSHYSDETIQQELYEIVRNSFIGRIKSIDMFGSLYYLVGNLPELFFKYKIDVDWNDMLKSFNKFLDISGIRLN